MSPWSFRVHDPRLHGPWHVYGQQRNHIQENPNEQLLSWCGQQLELVKQYGDEEVLNLRRFGSEGSSWPIWRYHPSICSDRLEETTKTSARISGFRPLNMKSSLVPCTNSQLRLQSAVSITKTIQRQLLLLKHQACSLNISSQAPGRCINFIYWTTRPAMEACQEHTDYLCEE